MFNNLGFGPNRFLFRRRPGPRLVPAFGGGGIGGPGNDIITVNNGGYTGSSGFTGSQGPAGGFTGSAGFTGSRGFVGSTGFTGSTGFVGSRGFNGSAGFNGSTGFTGSVGFTGSSGFTGSVGFVGSAGFVGSTGFTGSIGFTGSSGTASPVAVTNVLTATYTALSTDYYLCTLTVGPVTITLPTGILGTVYVVKDCGGLAAINPITIQGTGGQLIDGAATAVINTNFGSLTFVFNGTEWNIT